MIAVGSAHATAQSTVLHLGIVLKWLQYSSAHYSLDCSMGPFINLPHSGNSNLGQLQLDHWLLCADLSADPVHGVISRARPWSQRLVMWPRLLSLMCLCLIQGLVKAPCTQPSSRLTNSESPSTQYLRTLVPKTIPLVVFGTRVLKYWVLGPSGK